jgi:hypothetical protein
LVASPASAAPGWSRPMNVSGVMSIGEESPLVSVDSAGNATAVWRRYRGGKLFYENAVRQAGGPWSAPSRFFGGLEDAYGLQIAVDPLGNETAIWGRRVGRSWVVQSATRSVGGSWSAPVTLSAAGAGSALVAAGPEGNVTAVWLLGREEGWRSVVQSATRSAGGSWSAPVTLSPPRKAARSPQIALDPQGGATAVWEEEYSGATESSTRSVGGSWSAPVTLSANGVRAAWPQVAVDSQGNAAAVWAGAVFSGGRIQSHRIQTATRPAGGTWSAPVSISKAGHRHVQDPQIAVSPQGEATAIWQRSNGSYLVVQGATRPAGGGWSRPVDITTGHGRGGQHLQLVVDSWGNSTAIWEGYDTRPGPTSPSRRRSIRIEVPGRSPPISPVGRRASANRRLLSIRRADQLQSGQSAPRAAQSSNLPPRSEVERTLLASPRRGSANRASRLGTMDRPIARMPCRGPVG